MDREFRKFIFDFLRERGLSVEGNEISLLKGDGSKRNFWRINTPRTGLTGFIAMANPPKENFLEKENNAYLHIGTHLKKSGVPVPEILKHDLDQGWFIMEDMGRFSLQEALLASEDPQSLYERVLEELLRLQIQGAEGFDVKWCCQTEVYDREVMITLESYYFRDAFLHLYMGVKEKRSELEGPFRYLAESASGADTRFFMHRDFQSRNIMVSSGKIGIIDWQGGRLGPLGYDIASLLIDPYTELSTGQKKFLYKRYLTMLCCYSEKWAEELDRYYPYLAVQRNLQILGAFSYLTKVAKKTHFEKYIPAALRNLKGLLDELDHPALSPLKELVGRLAG